jgi:D-alanyl-D-alanine dipeptidase
VVPSRSGVVVPVTVWMTVMRRLRRHRITGLAHALALGCTGAPADAPRLVDAAALADGLVVDLRYAGAHNFVGAPVDGYERPVCLLSEPAARALARAQAELAAEGLGLVVFDCYRPQRAVDHFVRWSREPADPAAALRHHPRVPKDELFARGYIAARSSHSRGSTVDVGLVRGGEPLDCGTPFDFFDPRSHGDAAGLSEAARANRARLRRAMERHGFRPYPNEWWHFTLAGEPWPDRYFDRPVR